MLSANEYDKKIVLKKAAPLLKKMQGIKTIDEFQGMQAMTYEWMWAKMYGYLE